MIKRSTSRNRSGVILLVVISLLALFAAVGLAFVYYAEQEAAAARVRREAESISKADVTPELLFSFFMSQFLYDTDDVYSSMRGHSLARSLYGKSAGLNAVPFNGAGRLHYPMLHPSNGAPADNYFAVSYTYFNNPSAKEDKFRRDPELFGSWDPTDPTGASKPGNYVGGANVPWTYPDLQSMYLGALNANGEVLLPSFNRPWTGVVWNPSDPNFWNPWNKHLTLRPHNSYHMIKDASGNIVSFFPDSDEGPGAPDVKNVENSIGMRKPGGGFWMNDSYWMDIGFPVMTAPNGKKFKPLVASFVMDLDGKVNFSVHGNSKAVSNQGFGRWEVNPARVFGNTPVDPTEYQNLFQYRYGSNGFPDDQAPPNDLATRMPKPGPFYAPYDFDGVTPALMQLPAAGSFSCFPTYPFGPGYDNGSSVGPLAELNNHPAKFRYFPLPGTDDRVLADSNLEAQFRYRGTGSPGLTSDLFRLMPKSFAAPRARWQTTTRSMDLDAIGAVPWNYMGAGNSYDYKKFPNMAYIPPTNPIPKAVYSTPYRVWDSVHTYPYSIGAAVCVYPPGGLPFPYLVQPVPSIPPTGDYYNDFWLFNYLPGMASYLGGGSYRVAPPWINSEFNPEWRSTLSTLQKLNLNRVLPDYPQPVSGAIDPTSAGFITAVTARQTFAREIYWRLIQATGAMDPEVVGAPVADPLDPIGTKDRNEAYDQAVQGARYLAQLAVNIVDFVDNDDYNTPFPWKGEVLFGTELPRLVINEAYGQFDNDPTDPGLTAGTMDTAMWSRLNVWVELHNTFFDPLPGAAYPRDSSQALLQIQPTEPVYKVVLCKSPWQATGNFVGDPDPTNVLSTVTDWGNKKVVDPSKGSAGGGAGFYVLGPLPDPVNGMNFIAGADPTLTTTFNSPFMSAKIPAPQDTAIEYNVVLQRLACPHIPKNDAAPKTSPAYNPYITVDVMEKLASKDNRKFSLKGPTGVNPDPSKFSSTGRTQPYAGYFSLMKPQVPRPDPKNTTQPTNTFFWHNGDQISPTFTAGTTLKSPFDWLVQLDRPLVSPMELLQVSAYAPYLLTQKFVAPDGTAAQHRANWFGTFYPNTLSTGYDRQETLLYRFFELANVPDLMNPGSYRQPGKINLNTVWDRETFLALCDPPAALQPQALAMFRKMVDLRSPGVRGNQPIGPTPDDAYIAPGTLPPNYGPFKSLATGFSPEIPSKTLPPPYNSIKLEYQFPSGLNVNNTILRDDGSGTYESEYGQVPRLVPPRLFQLSGQPHPYKKYELLNKIFNNVTVRSNVFAVWITVGFFEAFDASPPDASGNTTPYRPAKLGKEIGRDEGRNIRHRMFAIVDRSQMAVPTPPPVLTNFVSGVSAPGAGQTVALAATVGPQVQLPPPAAVTWQWSIKRGTMLVVDKGTPFEETIVVTDVNNSVTPPVITADFNNTHAAGTCTVSFPAANLVPGPVPNSVLGNPGPQPRFDHRNNTAVITHFSIIE